MKLNFDLEIGLVLWKEGKAISWLLNFDGWLTKWRHFVDDLSKTRILDKVEYTLWDNSFRDLRGVELLLDAFPLDPMGATQVKDGLIAKGTTNMLQDYLDTVRGIMQIRDK
ncbi:hypothetical protein Tco_0692084 [Tanacetum coccineum]